MNALLLLPMNEMMYPDAVEAAKRWVGANIKSAVDVENGALVLAILYQWNLWLTKRPEEMTGLFHPFTADEKETLHCARCWQYAAWWQHQETPHA